MFLRKLLSADNKLTWVFIDLLIVIIGVYCAFVIQNSTEIDRSAREQNRVLTALKFELEQFRFTMGQVAIGMGNYGSTLQIQLEDNSYSDFSDFRFIEPQYAYQIVEYALNLQNPEVVDFELYNRLQALFVEIKKMEHVERLLTETSRRYRSMPEVLRPEDQQYQIIWTENSDNFRRFITLINDRRDIASRVSSASAEALPIINERLGEDRVKAIETEIITSNFAIANDEDHAVGLVRTFFNSFSEAEIRTLYRQLTNEAQSQ